VVVPVRGGVCIYVHVRVRACIFVCACVYPEFSLHTSCSQVPRGHFSLIVIDEAGMALEPEAVAPVAALLGEEYICLYFILFSNRAHL